MPAVAVIRDEHDIEVEDTCVVATPSGGCHYYYRAAGQRVTCSAGKLAAGIDVRGEGGYVVAPPSRIGTDVYSFVEGYGLDRLTICRRC